MNPYTALLRMMVADPELQLRRIAYVQALQKFKCEERLMAEQQAIDPTGELWMQYAPITAPAPVTAWSS